MDRTHWHRFSMVSLAAAYFGFYTFYSALTSTLTRGILPGIERPSSGFELLPAAAMGTVVGMALFLGLSGLWRHARRRQVLGREFPAAGRETLAAGFFHALIIGSTTLNYTFEGVSILFVLLLMRGGVLILSPIIDGLRQREVRLSCWVALTFSLAAVALALSDVDHYDLSLGVALSLAAYFAGYIGRFLIMEREAKSRETEVNRRYYVEEQMASSPMLLALLGATAVLGPGGATGDLRHGFTAFLGSEAALPALLVGLLYAGLSAFGSLIYVDRREYTYCVPVNRGASLLAGVVASYALTWLFGLQPPSLLQLSAAGLVLIALLVLGRPELVEGPRFAMPDGRRRLILFVCSGNTCRSPMAEAIARAELATRIGNRSPLQVLSAGLSVREGAPMTADAEVALRAIGVDPGSHRARPLTPELVERADVIFCMTASLRQAVLSILPGAAGKTLCIDPEGDVPDPIGSAFEIYEGCARRLRELVRWRLDERLAEA